MLCGTCGVTVVHTCRTQTVEVRCFDYVKVEMTWLKSGEHQTIEVPDDWLQESLAALPEIAAPHPNESQDSTLDTQGTLMHESPMQHDRQVSDWMDDHHQTSGVHLHRTSDDDDASSYDSQSGLPRRKPNM